MPDLERIGGVTGWQRAAALAAVHRIEMSSHLFPEVSAHLLAATPTCHWLEWVDWANQIVEEPLRIEAGFSVVPGRPRHGPTWNPAPVAEGRMWGGGVVRGSIWSGIPHRVCRSKSPHT